MFYAMIKQIKHFSNIYLRNDNVFEIQGFKITNKYLVLNVD